MKILIIALGYPIENYPISIGGISYSLKSLFETLKKNFHKISIFDIFTYDLKSNFQFLKEISLEISGNIISINSYLILEIKNGKNRFKIMKKTFPYSTYYGVKKKSHLIEVKINHNFSDGKNLQLFYYIYPKEKII